MLGEVTYRRSGLRGEVGLWAGFGLASLWLLTLPGAKVGSLTLVIALTATALGAELASVRQASRGNRFTVTGAYIACIACFWTPGWALVVALAATLLAELSSRRSLRQVVRRLSMGSSACAAGTLGVELLPPSFRTGESDIVGVLLFMVLFGSTCQLFRLFDGHFARSSQPSWRAWAADLSPLRLLAYVLAGSLIAVLARDNLAWVVPFTLVPVWAFRLGLLRRAHVAESYYDTVTALTLMLQRAHPDTHDHLDRVSRTAERVARQLGLSARRAELVRAAAVLHDIGKIAVDETVLDKPGPLTHAEREHVQNHAIWGAQILAPIQGFRELVPWIRYHHERPDGTGYPEKLIAEEIPIESKIIAVVDAYDAMTGGNRSYRAPLDRDAALRELQRWTDTQFDAAVVQAFSEVVTETAD